MNKKDMILLSLLLLLTMVFMILHLNKKCVVVFMSEDTIIYKEKINKGEIINEIPSPVKDGYTFSGWQLDGETFSFLTPIMHDIVLEALWEENNNSGGQISSKKYTVIFDSNGGSDISSQIVSEGRNVIKPTDPIRSGYTFVEWQLDGETFSFLTPISNNIKLKAVWTKVVSKGYKATLYIGNEEYKQLSCEFNNGKCMVNLPTITNEPGFLGWSKNKNSLSIIDEGQYTLTNDIALYAVIVNTEALKIYVSENGNDNNTGLSISDSIKTVQKGIEIIDKITKKLIEQRFGRTINSGDKERIKNDIFTITNVEINVAAGNYVGQSIAIDETHIDYIKTIKSISIKGVRSNGQNLTKFVGNKNTNSFINITLPSTTTNVCTNQNLPKCKYAACTQKSPTFKIWYLSINDYTNGIMTHQLCNSDIAYVDFTRIGNEYTNNGAGYGAIDLTYSSNNTIRHCKFNNIMNAYYWCNGKTVNRQSDCSGNTTSAGPWGMHAIYLAYNSNNNEVLNNTFSNVRAIPVKVRDYSKNNLVSQNIFSNAGYNGYMMVSRSGTSTVLCSKRENQSTGNEFKNNTLKGPYIDDYGVLDFSKYGKQLVANNCDNSNIYMENNKCTNNQKNIVGCVGN